MEPGLLESYSEKINKLAIFMLSLKLKADICTWEKSGHFYFGLTGHSAK